MPTAAEVNQAILGRWQVVYSEVEGQMTPVRDFATIILEHAANAFTIEKDGAVAHRGVFTIDTARTPYAMSLSYSESTIYPNATRVSIFQIEGDTLKACTAAPGLPAPTDFSTAPGQERVLSVHQRLVAGGGIAETGLAVSASRLSSQW
jgi:uncharacterized protein (TIGR03067 family)